MADLTPGRRSPDDYRTSWLDTGNRNGQEDLAKGAGGARLIGTDAGSVPSFDSPGLQNKKALGDSGEGVPVD